MAEADDLQRDESVPLVERAHPAARKRRSRARRVVAIVAIVAAVLVAIVLVLGGLFAWNRWWRYDDHADMQGEWFVAGTETPITIDEGSIRFTDDTAYAYAIDATDKTIRYTLGALEGRGRYWFSDDRTYLVIVDGDDFTGAGTAVEDLLRSFANIADAVMGRGFQPPQGEGVVALCRTPDRSAAAPAETAAEGDAAPPDLSAPPDDGSFAEPVAEPVVAEPESSEGDSAGSSEAAAPEAAGERPRPSSAGVFEEVSDHG